MQQRSDGDEIALWRRMLAYWRYGWGLSLCYWGLRTHEQALFRAGVRSFERATEVWPGFAAAYLRCGVVRGRELGEHREAIADLTRAVELAPEWPEAFLHRGLEQRFHGDPRAALVDLEQFLALGGDGGWRAEVERQIAMVREELGSE
jgi:tetratricopeptide (TPR) repeat protein